MTQVSSIGAASFFALIIGIDYYLSDDLRPLRGAVNDAREFEKYLLDRNVPPSNIVVLENEKATRANILSAFESHLLDNPNIPNHGEAKMIFFFAGHGSRFQAPRDLIAPDRRVEAICPVDERTTSAGGYAHAIPDYVLRWLFSELAEKKGPNITVILDCCHSDLDSHLWTRKPDAVQPRSYRGLFRSSHVLLAACLADEEAKEIILTDGTSHGRFTTALLNLLRSAPLQTTTYVELLNQMQGMQKWDGQTPHCAGTRSNRPIFGGNYLATGRHSVLLTVENPSDPNDPGSNAIPTSSQLFRVGMGTVDGVVPGTEFSAYDPNDSPLCTFFAESVHGADTILGWKSEKGQPPIVIPRWSRAVVSDWKSPPLFVYTPVDFPHTAYLFPTTPTLSPSKFMRASSLEQAHIIVQSDGDARVIEPLRVAMRKYQIETHVALKGNPARLSDVIGGVTHFNYFLDRANEVSNLKGKFTLAVHRLLGNYPQRTPDPRVGNDGDMVMDGAVRFTSEAGAKYGFTIRNTSNRDLFPHLFYFDPETYTIQHWYSPGGPYVKSPLPRNGGTVTIGMGSEHAFEFILSPGRVSRFGFLKLFVATCYIDLGWIQQELSPFDPRFEGAGRLRMSQRFKDTTRLPMTREQFDPMLTWNWDALTVTLTMTAPGIPVGTSTYADAEPMDCLPVWRDIWRNRLDRCAVLVTLEHPPDSQDFDNNDSQLFVVPIGTMEGVVAGTEFSAYDANDKFL
ncbi:caspase domain-containing protein [Mycena maculata]|uniref:Caspase domain-containing protein n=1 Tax=Mycena maculata TaxID=230809 RepID=A0AAD7NS31_9AGAR|nr:caspase domain-containing protein [Mycena maculata]